MSDEETCARLYRDLCDASIAKYADGIAAVLADDYALVHMTGMCQSKRAYIAAVLDGTLDYYSTEHDSVNVAIAPDGEHSERTPIPSRMRIESLCMARSTSKVRFVRGVVLAELWVLGFLR